MCAIFFASPICSTELQFKYKIFFVMCSASFCSCEFLFCFVFRFQEEKAVFLRTLHKRRREQREYEVLVQPKPSPSQSSSSSSSSPSSSSLPSSSSASSSPVALPPSSVPSDEREEFFDFVEPKPVFKKVVQLLHVKDIVSEFLSSDDARVLQAWAKLCEVYLVQTPTSVDCERGVSHLALIKTKLRNKLSQDSLNQQMFVQQNAPSFSDFCASNTPQRIARYFLFRKSRNVRVAGVLHPPTSAEKQEWQQMDSFCWDVSKVCCLLFLGC